MRKKTFLVLLALCMLLMSMCPVGALAEEAGSAVTRGLAEFDAWLMYDSLEQAYYIFGHCSGEAEYKTFVVTLYKQVGGRWQFIDSAITSGYADVLELHEKVNAQLTSGTYKQEMSETTPTQSGSSPKIFTL